MLSSEISKCFNEISSHSHLYEEEVNNKIKELGNTASFYDVFYASRSVIYNCHKQETINKYMSSMTRDEATLKYELEFITEKEYVFYRKHYEA